MEEGGDLKYKIQPHLLKKKLKAFFFVEETIGVTISFRREGTLGWNFD